MVLTANLPEGNWRSLVQLAYASSVVFSFPLQLFPAVGIFTGFFKRAKLNLQQKGYDAIDGETEDLENTATKSPKNLWKGNLGRSALVILLCFISVMNVDKLDKMVSLLGALFGVPLALIIP
eukprot:CAMPEP_0114328446 /NCGR_PEP_ID=MMETSP0101-20121206/407_1 /TAXON_ID=38822 ORGANISM="Pteridomonas danica, Strain PT" /NCGR_SAMPLE_ID=MMETSP0101 /ASSEMBLY_ACC=CAM_ASM_000211 /LENGTH=121 /DNA_ID=CAMNT_0001457761 /DNA_START=1 /DNA_END=362 /DNA_ORIENTATION=+